MKTDYPEFGKWLLDRNKNPSRWLNRKIDGKVIWEPINIIIKDNISKSPEDSKSLLYYSLGKAGFKIRWGHITPRYGIIGENCYKFLPGKFFHAFSDKIWLKENNHVRFFGPHFKDGKYYYSGAASRETAFTHKYISFNSARDKLSLMLNEKSEIKITGFVEMRNVINNESEITGDHDGKAELLEVNK